MPISFNNTKYFSKSVSQEYPQGYFFSGNEKRAAEKNFVQTIQKYKEGAALPNENKSFAKNYLAKTKSRAAISVNRRKKITNYHKIYQNENENENNNEKPGCFSRVVHGVKKMFCGRGGRTRSKRSERKRKTQKRR